MQQILGIYEKETALGLAASSASERPYWERISQALRYWQDSPQRAVQEFLAGLSEEDARLQTGLGISYYLASEQEFHLHAAVYWFSRASDNGFALAQCALGVCYLTGAGLEANPQSAEGWFRTAAEQGYAPGQFMLGKHLYQHQFGASDHKVQAVGWFRKSAELGYIPAQYVLGLCYLDGSALPQDREQGIFWIGQAAEQGDRTAIRKMIELHLSREELPIRLHWLRQGAESGDAELQYQLGVSFETGAGVEQSYHQAAVWYRKAAERLLPSTDRLTSSSK